MIRLLILDSETLDPGEELEFIEEWQQADNRGEPIPPSVCSVRALLDLE